MTFTGGISPGTRLTHKFDTVRADYGPVLRMTIGTTEENEKFIGALKKWLGR